MVFRAARAFTVSRCGITSSVGSAAPTVVVSDDKNLQKQQQSSGTAEPAESTGYDLGSSRRWCVEQLVAEAARKDWQELTSRYREWVIYAPVQVCNASTRTSVEVPLGVRHLHRKYWQHIMQDSVSYFDAVVAERTTPPGSPMSNDGRGDADAAVIVVGPQALREAKQAAFLAVMDRLSRRNLWRSPVTVSVATKDFSKLSEETQSISQPHHEMWKRQKAQRRVLRSIPPGQYFVSPVTSPPSSRSVVTLHGLSQTAAVRDSSSAT